MQCLRRPKVRTAFLGAKNKFYENVNTGAGGVAQCKVLCQHEQVPGFEIRALHKIKIKKHKRTIKHLNFYTS